MVMIARQLADELRMLPLILPTDEVSEVATAMEEKATTLEDLNEVKPQSRSHNTSFGLRYSMNETTSAIRRSTSSTRHIHHQDKLSSAEVTTDDIETGVDNANAPPTAVSEALSSADDKNGDGQSSSDVAMTNHTQFYFLHMPKAGGGSMQGELSKNGAWVYNFGMGRTTELFDSWKQKFPERRVFMTEGIGFNQHPPAPSITIVRDPTTHVLFTVLPLRGVPRPLQV